MKKRKIGWNKRESTLRGRGEVCPRPNGEEFGWRAITVRIICGLRCYGCNTDNRIVSIVHNSKYIVRAIKNFLEVITPLKPAT